MKHAPALLCGLLLVTLQVPAQAAEGDSTTVYITGVLMDAPECTVNGNNKIDVDFGKNVNIHEIDGTTYGKTQLVYSLNCTSLTSEKLKLSVAGDPAPFGTGLLKTNKDGLGIRLYHGNTVLPAGNGMAQAVNFTWLNNSGMLPPLYAVPVAQSGVRLTGGDFTGSGTLVIEYQ